MQQTLWRNGDPWTSVQAALSADVSGSLKIVLDAFSFNGPMDDRKLCVLVRHAMSDSRARGARCELARSGHLECVGTVGTPARRVWKLRK